MKSARMSLFNLLEALDMILVRDTRSLPTRSGIDYVGEASMTPWYMDQTVTSTGRANLLKPFQPTFSSNCLGAKQSYMVTSQLVGQSRAFSIHNGK